MTRRLITSKTLWGLHRAQGRTEEISAWVAANGIEPDDVSTNHDLTVEDTAGARSIRCTVYLRTLDGSKYVDGPLGGAAVAERRMPLLVEPPEHWPVWALTDRKEQP